MNYIWVGRQNEPLVDWICDCHGSGFVTFCCTLTVKSKILKNLDIPRKYQHTGMCFNVEFFFDMSRLLNGEILKKSQDLEKILRSRERSRLLDGRS